MVAMVVPGTTWTGTSRRAFVACAVLGIALAAMAAPASARTDARATFPTAVSAGATLTVTGRVMGRTPAARVELQHKAGGRWRARASRRLTPAGRRFTLRWRPLNATSRLVLRIAVLRGRRVVGVTRARTVRIRSPRGATPVPGAPASAPAGADASPPASPGLPPEAPAASPAAPGPPTADPAHSGNPFEGQRLWVDPDGPAAQIARSYRAAGRDADAALMAKIADTPTALWLGDWTGPDPAPAVTSYLTGTRDAGALPLLVLYHLPGRDCGSYSAGGATDAVAYRQWIDRVAYALGGPAAVIVEPDALAQLDCMPGAQAQETVDLVRYAGAALADAPGTAVYLDAGNSTWQSETVIAQRLRAAGVERLRGFALNVSNYHRTADELAYGTRVAGLLGGARFLVDTGRNGQGPTTDGAWCNPPGRGLGARPTTATGSVLADALLWIKLPGESDGPCNGGPAAGAFWPEGALALARASAW
jgi:endoglucanase